ncbi:hypothetical protein EYZ11_001103 [Aspergillus tanneri]|uniref:Retrovirus-related Pol polyprotein from transposon TNT 1-94-like beta-barrel domain-containing protein n=1 Tax=Aspergillus tanneri TaxID=1220188 RepID=A0A4S3JVB7_9EURO|nr:uncharacterized protein ATNIH1004_004441 [Aspergillus tanneri]KAA8648556.1 hypothetical protein ATNIH1004_004441 [Aspergillus tanneri]THC99379.1 hypothetical protein EYZ11_001103 [Aspergillus tanneri]
MADLKEHHHDYRHRRPHTPQSPSQKSPSNAHKRCWDWIIVGGNCHYAKNRTAFRSYRRAPGKIGGSKVLGVGTVELKVRRTSNDERSSTLVLTDVLHMPNARCNGLSISKYREANPLSGVEMEKEHFQATSHIDGEPLWCADEFCGMSKVALAGNPKGESYLRDGQVYMLSVIASSEELERLNKRLRDTDWTVHS